MIENKFAPNPYGYYPIYSGSAYSPSTAYPQLGQEDPSKYTGPSPNYLYPTTSTQKDADGKPYMPSMYLPYQPPDSWLPQGQPQAPAVWTDVGGIGPDQGRAGFYSYPVWMTPPGGYPSNSMNRAAEIAANWAPLTSTREMDSGPPASTVWNGYQTPSYLSSGSGGGGNFSFGGANTFGFVPGLLGGDGGQ